MGKIDKAVKSRPGGQRVNPRRKNVTVNQVEDYIKVTNIYIDTWFDDIYIFKNKENKLNVSKNQIDCM